ncbi:glucan biosynthesis protein D [Zhengella mangrovi]|uniref:Glucan biosynthesis protein D n=1 Tax=Zhengella mangrovi TaxID=1982044 RepID=A0A2G1QKD8_9HYPH|nr:glucan biosynthesis protein G [Zhengella mangrovi]PHP65934.1 glucan biosynthesis protein D [Zhengella mangrovi]
MQRRQFNVAMALGLLATTTLARSALAQDGGGKAAEAADDAIAFDFETLTGAAKTKAGQAFAPPSEELPEALAALNYDDYRHIAYDPDRTVWRGNESFELQAFHMGWLFRSPVNVFTVSGGQARPVRFTAKDFIYREPLDAEKLQQVDMPGVAGFRILYPLNNAGVMDELVAFQGASYFRALGRGSRYGLSARGLAINTATEVDEEFPRFSDFYVEKPERGDGVLTVYALMDSPSVTGAYRFVITPGDTTQIEVTARIFLREDVSRLGIAPLTSMFLFNGVNRHAFDDYRESVHDSEGLKIVRADGEEMWRSLNNPTRLASSFFNETNPRGFGLFQRSRAFDDYQDAGAHYEMRPSVLVEPLGEWGPGMIGLIEIPTELEVNDNIVVLWIPEGEAKAGQSHEFRYRLTWGSIEEDRSRLARVVEISSGDGGVSGVQAEDKQSTRKFVIDFEGGPLGNLPPEADVKAAVSVSAGKVAHATVSQVETTHRWRMVIDLELPEDGPVEINAYLDQRSVRISENWLIQWRKGDEQRS